MNNVAIEQISILKQEHTANVDDQLSCSVMLAAGIALALGILEFVLYSFWIVVR